MRFTKTMPESISLMKRSRSWSSLVQTLAPRPKRVSLAMRMASLIFLARNRFATGPKNSSEYAGEFFGISDRTVGA